jgi:hypothetical protein
VGGSNRRESISLVDREVLHDACICICFLPNLFYRGSVECTSRLELERTVSPCMYNVAVSEYRSTKTSTHQRYIHNGRSPSSKSREISTGRVGLGTRGQRPIARFVMEGHEENQAFNSIFVENVCEQRYFALR